MNPTLVRILSAASFCIAILSGCVRDEISRADQLRSAGAFVEARDAYLKALTRSPFSYEIHYGLGLALSAEAMYKTELGLAKPNDWFLALYHVTTAQNLHNTPEARRTLAVLHFNLGSALKKAGDLENAIERLEHAISYDSTLIKPLNMLGAMYQSQGNLTRASQCYSRVIALNPSYAPGHFNLGAVAWAEGDFINAARHFQNAASANPANPLFTTWAQKAEARIE